MRFVQAIGQSRRHPNTACRRHREAGRGSSCRHAEAGAAGPFSPVYVSDSLTLDFDQADGGFPVLHYAFRVDDAGFDGIVARLRALGLAFRSTPHGPVDAQVNSAHGGRIVYWSEPDGHVWEALTLSYAREPRTP